MGFSKSVNEARSKMDVAQSELDIYLSGHNTAVSQLSKAKEALTAASETLKERKTAIRDIEAKLPQTERELKEVNLCSSVFQLNIVSLSCMYIFLLLLTSIYKVTHVYFFYSNEVCVSQNLSVGSICKQK